MGLDASLISGEEPFGEHARGDGSIAPFESYHGASGAPVLSLHFEAGKRPSATEIDGIVAARAGFSVSHDAAWQANGTRWLELLANGMTFDLSGIAPGKPMKYGMFLHFFDLPPEFDTSHHEAIVLAPGPHLAGGEAMIPVVRSEMWLAAQLCELPGVAAVGWSPARALSSPVHFRKAVSAWLDGGVFPGLGLAALNPTAEGGLESEGLAFFTGQELQLDPDLAQDKAEGAKLALRLMHELVEAGGIEQVEEVTAPDGGTLLLEPVGGGSKVLVRRVAG